MIIIPYILLLVLVAAFQVLIHPMTTFFGIGFNLPMLLVLLVAWRQNELRILWFAFFVAVVANAPTPLTMGWQVLVMALIAVGASHARARLNADSPAAQLAILFAGILLHNICTLLIERADNLPYQLWRTALTGAVYTLAVVAVIFYVRDTLTGRHRRGATV